MARPLKAGLDYFPHDTDAVNDEKIEAMRAEYGNDGYAFYFIILERVFRAENGEINISNTTVKKALASKIGVDVKLFERMLSTALELELFSKADFDDRNVLTSRGIKRRYDAVSKLRERWRKNKKNILEENPEENSVENSEETPERKGKETKEKDNLFLQIKNLRSRYDPETLQLIDHYLDILRTTRRSGKIADSVLLQVYEQMDKHPVIVVKASCLTVIHNPSHHSKRENYLYGILRNTDATEAAKRIREYEKEQKSEPLPLKRDIVEGTWRF